MSHRDTCPDPWEARSEGARAFNSGAGSWRNPHAEECEEAAAAWRRGYHAAEDQRRIEQAHQERAEEERQQAEYERQQSEEYEAAMAAEAAAAQAPEAEGA